MKITDLTNKHQVYIKNKKQLLLFCDLIDYKNCHMDAPCWYTKNEHGRGFSNFRKTRLEEIPASKFLKSTPSKKELQQALSKVGEELSEFRQRLNKLESIIEPKTATDIQVHFDEVESKVLPEKWAVEMTIDTNKVIGSYINEKYSRTKYENQIGYYVYPNGFCKTYGYVPEGYTEISFDDFKKYVFKEEDKQHEIDFSKAGLLVESKKWGCIIMTSGKHTPHHFTGTYVVSKIPEDLGKAYDSIIKDGLTLYQGQLTLKNE